MKFGMAFSRAVALVVLSAGRAPHAVISLLSLENSSILIYAWKSGAQANG